MVIFPLFIAVSVANINQGGIVTFSLTQSSTNW